MFHRTIACALAGATLLASLSAAAAYPDKPVRIIVPNPPGGAVDVVTRKIAQKLTQQTGQSFVVENKPGASGTIGTSQVVSAAADGYTLLANDNSYTTLPYVFRKLSWDHQTALVPIAPFAFSPVVLGVKADSRFKDLASLVAYAKAHPGEVTFGSGGSGSGSGMPMGGCNGVDCSGCEEFCAGTEDQCAKRPHAIQKLNKVYGQVCKPGWLGKCWYSNTRYTCVRTVGCSKCDELVLTTYTHAQHAQLLS